MDEWNSLFSTRKETKSYSNPDTLPLVDRVRSKKLHASEFDVDFSRLRVPKVQSPHIISAHDMFIKL
jgi:hypothetical protein